ncbi:hypothetical protein A1OE_712 [Candidatus Endolissoclinum faulkneri L2]|uniref:Uncharacterized protein n=1 Tax=Candidatus Endolissoclinum faulkneri L2 TaxID=1193729 RepID=K7YH72_9PROT|nr:hypothetical protein A1OE_712 [Candidatus Endolissoclinum faulkneri L2]
MFLKRLLTNIRSIKYLSFLESIDFLLMPVFNLKIKIIYVLNHLRRHEFYHLYSYT